MRTRSVRFVALVSLLVFCARQGQGGGAAAFQSDELPEEDDEWGITGGVSATADNAKPASAKSGSSSGPATSERFSSRVNVPSTDRKVQFPLEHSFGGSKFLQAGVFTARLRDSVKGGQTLSKFRLSRDAFSAEDKKRFEELIENDGFYSIRVPSNVLNPGESFVVSSVKARCLAEADFRERFDFQMDQGNVIGVSYGGSTSCSYPRSSRIPSRWTFDPLIIVKTAEQASRSLFAPELAEVAKDEDIIADDGTIVKKLPEKSFWSKYWMYIVPVGLILVNAVTQMANLPEEGVPGQGAAGTQPRVGGGPTGGAARRR